MLIAAIESDPSIFLRLLPETPLDRLEDWHRDLDTALAKEIALDVCLTLEVDETNSVFNCLRRGLLAEELAARIEGAHRGETRLATLLAAAVSASHTPAPTLTAIPTLVREAIDCQDEPLARLEGAPPLITIVNASGRLAAEASPSGELLTHIGHALAIEPARVEEARSAANWQYEQLSRKFDFSPVDRLPSIRAALMFRALARTEGDVSAAIAAASHFLGAAHTLFFERRGVTLRSMMDGEPVSIRTDDNTSVIAAASREATTKSASSSPEHFIERQLSQRYASTVLTAVPVPSHGVIATMLPDDRGAPPLLLAALAEATAHLLDRADGAVISVDDVQLQVQELIHEVGNPLTIAQNYLKALSTKLGDDHTAGRDIDAVATALTRANTLIQRFRHLGSEAPLRFAETNLNRLLSETAGLIVEGQQAIRIDYRLDDAIPTLSLPADALSQIFVNLLKNAVEALLETGEPVIGITTAGAVNVGGRHFIEVEISDNGPGMNASDRLAIFETGTSDKGEGRGLGLGIVSRLVQDIGGMISCRESREGTGGTVFQLLIPFESPAG